MLDIFKISIENREFLKTEYETIKNAALDEFTSLIQTSGNVSMNKTLNKMLNAVSVGRLVNIHEKLKLENPQLDDNALFKLFKEAQPGFYERRTVIDSNLVDGKKLKYGALNIGNMGAFTNSYGNFCVIIKRDDLSHFQLIFLKNDSAQFYVNTDNTFKFDEFRSDLSCLSHCHFLAGIKHQNDINSGNKSSWADILCSSSCYIEAMLSDDITWTNLLEIRITKTDEDLFNFLSVKLLDNTITDIEKNELKDFTDLKEKMSENNINFTTV